MDEATIIDVTLDGRGVAEQEGKKVFIPYAITGERVRYERTKKKKKYDEAKLVEVLHASPQRVKPRCSYFTICGGCVAQHIAVETQIAFKQHAVFEVLQRIGHVTPQRVYPPVVDKAWGYRRRARLAVKYVAKKGRALVGFREKSAPFLTDMLSCEVLHPCVANLISPLSTLITGLSIRDKIPQIECSVAENDTALVFRVLESPSANDLQCLRSFADEQGLRIYLQTKGPETIALLDESFPVDPLCYTLTPSNIKIEFSPADFIQVHAEVNRKMVRQAIDWVRLKDTDKVLDLFCGLGNFSLPIAKQVSSVFAVEGDEGLVARAKQNAVINDIRNCVFAQADLFNLDEQSSWLQSQWDVVIIDPPRTGAREVLDYLPAMQARKVLYVSCHPGTLARDAGHLVNELGYVLTRTGILNMFPHTGHVETMALFERR